jgi:hypothetical protein
MPIRRINFTQRQRIHRDDIGIVLRRDDHGAVFFDTSLDLSSYGFAPDARLFIEAYRQTTMMRFDFGTVSVPAPPPDRYLTDFESEAEIMFRVRVTAVSERPGVLLGEADQLRPRNPDEEPDQRISLLPPVPADLAEEIWRVDFEAAPILLVNRNLPDWKQTVRSETFRAFVYPAAFREIVHRILFLEGHTTTEDMSDWRSRWLLFTTRLPGAGGVPKSRDEFDDWIENAAAAFARQFTLRSRYVKELTE